MLFFCCFLKNPFSPVYKPAYFLSNFIRLYLAILHIAFCTSNPSKRFYLFRSIYKKRPNLAIGSFLVYNDESIRHQKQRMRTRLLSNCQLPDNFLYGLANQLLILNDQVCHLPIALLAIEEDFIQLFSGVGAHQRTVA